MKISKYRLMPRLSAPITVSGALVVLLSCSQPPSHLTIATATPGGTYHAIGTDLARILDRVLREQFDSVRAIPTSGSSDNIDRLATGEVKLALVTRSALLAAQDSILEEIRLLADLYPDVVQVLIRRDSVVGSLQDLTDMRVYLGRNGSGPETIAREMLSAVGVSSMAQDAMRRGTENDTYDEASSKLVSDSLDAAFFLGGTPVEAVESAMATGRFKLLDLSSDMGALQDSIPGFSDKYEWLTVLAQTYGNQPDSAQTIATTAQLVARRDLDDDVVVSTLEALYTRLDLLLHARAR